MLASHDFPKCSCTTIGAITIMSQDIYESQDKPEYYLFVYAQNDRERLIGWLKVDDKDEVLFIPISATEEEEQEES
jgi:hypothetical protein